MIRILPCAVLALVLLAASPARAQQQDDVMQAPQAPLVIAPDALSQAQAAAARGDAAEALSRYLRVLAARPDDVAALSGAGRAALEVGDINAAAGFFARAEALDGRNGPVKAGLARTFLQQGDARAALRLFREAVEQGVPAVSIAADRGLAYDLRGDQRRAQAEYHAALLARPGDEETLRRLAISQAIGGDRVAALATLDPLLRKQDVPAWRARAFVFALTGDGADALSGAALVMPRDQVDALAPYLPRLAVLKAADKAAAIHLGRFPGEGPPARLVNNSLPPNFTFAPPAFATPDPFALYVPPTYTPEQDAKARAKALTDALADARARAAARAHVPAAIRARGADLLPSTALPTGPEPAEPRLTRRERLKQQKAEKDEKAKKTEDTAARAEKREPARHWAQVAGGANKATLPRAWAALKEKYPKALAGRAPWTAHYRFTNRLLVGPFPTSDAAQDWVSERRKEGLPAFRVETNAGDAVERLGGG